MITVNAREAKEKFSALLDRVEQGEEVVVMRKGKVVTVMTPPHPSIATLPDLESFRSSLNITGQSVLKTLLDMRDEDRV